MPRASYSFRDTLAGMNPLGALLGRLVHLPVVRFAGPGAYLGVDPSDTSPGAEAILLPGAEVPEGTGVGDVLEVFVTLDSEDRPLATTHMPKLALGEVAFLRVTALAPFGAFFDWGLPKELLVPHKEQTRELVVGDVHAIGLYRDDTGRLAGTMRVSELLKERGAFEQDEWVEGEAWRKEVALGVFVIVERAFVGLVPASEPTTLTRGQAARFRVSNVLPDGKIELSLRGHGHEEIDGDAARVLTRLRDKDAPRVGDHSSPEDVREAFGLSKKAFKRAAGRLLREGKARFDPNGILVPK